MRLAALCSFLTWPVNVICESAVRAGIKQEVRSDCYQLLILHAVDGVRQVTQPSRGYFYTTDEGKREENKCVISRRL